MSTNEQPNTLPIELFLEDKKKIIVFNLEHESILEHIANELKADKYNSIVTMDNFSDMKESSNELGRISKLISRFRIDKKNSEMEDINIFETNFKGYCSLIDAKQSEIKKGLEVFEAETRKAVEEEQNQDPAPFIKNEAPYSKEVQERANKLIENEKQEVPVVADDGKVEKTLSIKIRVPEKATKEQIIGAVIKMIKADTLPLERFEVN